MAEITSSFDELLHELNQSEDFRSEFRKQKPLYDFIQQLVLCRKELGISQSELAERLGKYQSSVSRIESGDHDVRLSTLIEIAEALGVYLDIRLYHTPDTEYADEKDTYKQLFTATTLPKKQFTKVVSSLSEIEKV